MVTSALSKRVLGNALVVAVSIAALAASPAMAAKKGKHKTKPKPPGSFVFSQSNNPNANFFKYDIQDNVTGDLTPIVHSAQALSVVGPNGIAADIGFTPNGRWLVATMRFLPLTTGTMGQNGLIDTFVVHPDGSVGPAIQNTAATPTPFGFRFTSSGTLVDTSAGRVTTTNNMPPPLGDGTQINGSLQTYTVHGNGTLTPISNAPSGGRAACWVVLTKDNKFAFVANTDPYTFVGSLPLHVAPHARFEGGLDLVAPRSVRPADIPRLFRYAATGRGQLDDSKLLSAHDLDRIEIRCDRPLPLQVDGEDLGDVTEATFVAERGVVRLLV